MPRYATCKILEMVKNESLFLETIACECFSIHV